MPSYLICLDANILIRMVIHPADEAIKDQLAAWNQTNHQFIAPTLLFHEVTNGIYQYHKQAIISADAAKVALESALEVPINLYGDKELHQEALQMTQDLTLAASYDAHYLALSLRQDAQLWTTDKRLYNSVKDIYDWVNLWSVS